MKVLIWLTIIQQAVFGFYLHHHDYRSAPFHFKTVLKAEEESPSNDDDDTSSSFITVGSPIPDVNIQVIRQEDDDNVVSIQELVGNKGKSLLIGMPGAFTTTCSKEHFPGYIQQASNLKENLQISKIIVLTTNDVAVNQAWGNMLGLQQQQDEDFITIVSDGNKELVREMGLIQDMGFGIGERSKRFVLLIDNGSISYVAVDDGMETCETTSASALVDYLSAEKQEKAIQQEEADQQNQKVIFAVLAAAILAYLSTTTTTVDGALQFNFDFNMGTNSGADFAPKLLENLTN